MCGKILRTDEPKRLNSFTKVATACIDDHQFKEEEMGSVGEFSKVCSQIVLKCLYLARSGRPDILWSVNNLLVLSLTGRACDKTSSTFDQIHLSRMRIETILSCWKYSNNNAD